MKKSLACVFILLAAAAALDGCGDDTNSATAASGTGDSVVESPCAPLGSACDPPGVECCNGACADVGLDEPVCVSPGGYCALGGGACVTALDCCSLSCVEGLCQSSGECASQGAACEGNADCCSNNCNAGACGPGRGGCIDAGKSCTDDHGCCSGNCSNGACMGSGPACLATGEGCAADAECCSRACEKATSTCAKLPYCRPAGEACTSNAQCCSLTCADGYCARLTFCRPAFEPCSGDGAECCSGTCATDLLGFLRCLPAGGCRPSGPAMTSEGQLNLYGEACAEGCDCCTSVCEADESGASRCKKLGDPTCGSAGQVKLPAGEICDEACQCESGICAEPTPPEVDEMIPKRCLTQVPDGAGGAGGVGGGGGGGACSMDGAPCFDPADCCSGLCLPSKDTCGFACAAPAGGSCDGVEPAGACTTTADCCGESECIPVAGGALVCDVPPPPPEPMP